MQATARTQDFGHLVVVGAIVLGILAAVLVGAMALTSDDATPQSGRAASVEPAPYNRPADRMREYIGDVGSQVAVTTAFVMPADRLREHLGGAGSPAVTTKFVVPADRMREFVGAERADAAKVFVVPMDRLREYAGVER
jgi:hypothetical protein